MAAKQPLNSENRTQPSRRPRAHRAWSVAAGLLLVSTLSHAGIYRWQDSQGVTHYSQSPPDVEAYQTVKGPPPPPQAPPAADNPPQDNSTQSQPPSGQQQASADQAPKLSPAQRQQKCTYEQSRLASLQRRPQVLLQYPDGHVKRLTPEERQAQITNTQNRISQYCGD